MQTCRCGPLHEPTLQSLFSLVRKCVRSALHPGVSTFPLIECVCVFCYQGLWSFFFPGAHNELHLLNFVFSFFFSLDWRVCRDLLTAGLLMAVVDYKHQQLTGPWTLLSLFFDQPVLFIFSQGGSCAILSHLAHFSHPHHLSTTGEVKGKDGEQQTTERLLVVCLSQRMSSGSCPLPRPPGRHTLTRFFSVASLTRVLSSIASNGHQQKH